MKKKKRKKPVVDKCKRLNTHAYTHIHFVDDCERFLSIDK